MKKTNLIAFGTVFMISAGIARAAHVWEDPQVWWAGHFTYDTAAASKFTTSELSMDAFGSFTAGERRFNKLFETNIRHGIWGGGVGLNYFFTREIGIGADINIPANGGNFVDQAVGSLIARWPFESWHPTSSAVADEAPILHGNGSATPVSASNTVSTQRPASLWTGGTYGPIKASTDSYCGPVCGWCFKH